MSTPPLSPGKILGLDVSRCQGVNIPWPSVAASDVQFVVIKSTEGETYVDSQFKQNVLDAMAQEGIPLVGAYHVFRPDRDPLVQAKHYTDVSEAAVNMRPVLDFEVVPTDHNFGRMAEQAMVWVEEVERLWSAPVVLYTYVNFALMLPKVNAAVAELSKRQLWIADYRKHPAAQVPPPWKEAAVWQWDGDGGYKLPVNSAGKEVDADYNWFDGTLDELLKGFGR